MTTKVVVGLGWGDEGKGLTVDYLCSKSSTFTIVVRFSGGQNAGHTVHHEGKSHVFSSFGSGTMRGIPTYISKYCTFNPVAIAAEAHELGKKGIKPLVMIDPLARLTSPADVAWGRYRELEKKHGSCGKGVGATMDRHERTPLKLFAVDLLHPAILDEKLRAIEQFTMDRVSGSVAKAKLATSILVQTKMFRLAMQSDVMRRIIDDGIHPPTALSIFQDIIFEGSQGIMLDMEHGTFPNVTYSSTTSKNAMALIDEWGLEPPDIYYVTRCYQTRHGNGWMSSNKPVKLVNNADETNKQDKWQGEFRVREIDYDILNYALKVDEAYAYGCRRHLMVTCMDQLEESFFDHDKLGRFSSVHYSYSPDSQGVREVHGPVRSQVLTPA